MVHCFICQCDLKDLKVLRSHFKFTHNNYNFTFFKCVEGDCNRSFYLYNSFRRHFEKEHAAQASASVDESSAVYLETVETLQNDFISPQESLACLQTLQNKPSSVDTALSIFIATLYGNVLLPRNVVQKVVNGLEEFLNTLAPAVIECINNVCSGNPLPTDIGEMVTSLISSPLESYKTERNSFNRFLEIGTYIKPEAKIVGHRLDRVKKQGITRIETVECVEHFIPLRQVLRKYFSLENILAETLQYMDSLKNKKSVENFIQGTFWKSRMARNASKIVMPLFMYFDDYETGNVLGSHSGTHKIGAVYVSIPCLPPWRSSVLSNIFLALLFHSSDRVSFGNQAIFKPVIDEFNFLTEVGIEINIPSFNGTLFFELALILGDNLGIHSMIGFTESFSANFPCRVCKVSKVVLKTQCFEDKNLLRDTGSYEVDLALNDVSLTGIKERCVWLDVNFFELYSQVGFDIMHDVLEGVAKYIVSFILLKYTQTYKLFSLKDFNDILSMFDFGHDNKNKPCPIEREHLIRGNVRLSSGEMLTLLRFFGLMVGDFVPRDDSSWAMFIKLRQVLDILLSSQISVGSGELLQVLVGELNEQYIKLTNDALKPKFHHLIHYHSCLLKYGPMSSIWSMRYESKHRQSKMAARASCNRINLTLSLAIKHQLQLNELFLRGKLCEILSIGPKQCLPITEKKDVQKALELDTEKSLIKISWAKMSSIRYSKGTILVKNICNDGYLLDFMTVDKIYIYDSNRLIFSGSLLKTLNFDEHYYAYLVEITPSLEQVVVFLESLLSPIPNTKNIIRNGKHFVVLRSSL